MFEMCKWFIKTNKYDVTNRYTEKGRYKMVIHCSSFDKKYFKSVLTFYDVLYVTELETTKLASLSHLQFVAEVSTLLKKIDFKAFEITMILEWSNVYSA